MKLTGLPLIVTAALLALAVIAATVLLWSRFGRWRLLSRFAGLVLAEALVVATVGLIANRSEEFYPSWQALRGDTGTTSSTTPPPAGRLDAQLAGGRSSLPWKPASLASWHLAGTPTVVLPHDYRDHPGTTYPVVVVLPASTAEVAAAVAAHPDGVVTLVATPTAATTVAALGRMGVALGEDVRVTGYGWALVASSRWAATAAALVDGGPARFAAEALIGAGARPHGAEAFALVKAVAGAKVPAGSSGTSAGGSSGSSAGGSSGTPSGSPSKAVPPGRALPPGELGGSTTTGHAATAGNGGATAGHGATAGNSAAGGTASRAGKGTAAGKTASGHPANRGKSASGTVSGVGKSSPGNGAGPAKSPAGKPPAAGHRPPPGTTVTPGKATPPAKQLPPTTLTCPAGSVWKVAARWAAEQTSQPLQPAVRLPAGAHSAGGPPPGGLPSGGAPSGGTPGNRHTPRTRSSSGSPAGLLSGGAASARHHANDAFIASASFFGGGSAAGRLTVAGVR